jgi:hypothetical protein
VKQFALPLLATIAEIWPFSIDFFVIITGAATTLFDVNTAAALLFSLKIIPTPYFPFCAPEAKTPSTAQTPPLIIFMIIHRNIF